MNAFTKGKKPAELSNDENPLHDRNTLTKVFMSLLSLGNERK
jgi:hypothetical protein